MTDQEFEMEIMRRSPDSNCINTSLGGRCYKILVRLIKENKIFEPKKETKFTPLADAAIRHLMDSIGEGPYPKTPEEFTDLMNRSQNYLSQFIFLE